MIAVILAGGSGSRLWPLSTPDKPKHLMSVNGSSTLLQDTLDRAAVFADDIYVVTDISHSKLVAGQLKGRIDEDHIIVEPDRRGTASAIVLALATLESLHGPDMPVCFMHADHYITDKQAFAESVEKAISAARKHQSIALIGVEPDYPATGFGYIKKSKQLSGGAFGVAGFEEKPDLDTAQEYLSSSKYVWNLGLFAAPIDIFIKEMDSHAKHLHLGHKQLSDHIKAGRDYSDTYKSMINEAIDTALIEKSSNLVVVPAGFDWLDIGSYKDLHEVLPKTDEYGNTIEGQVVAIDAKDSIIMEQTGVPLAILGLDDVVVVSTDKGILICSKEYSQRIKEATEQMP